MAFKPIEILINAKDNASGVFDRLSNKLKVVGAAIATYFGIKAFAGVVEGAADFEQAMSRVKAATSASAEEMAQLKNAAEGLEDFGGVEAALALENLGKAGLSAGEAIAALGPSAALAKAGGVELGVASEALTQVIFGLGLSFNDVGRVADVLAGGANATKTSVAGLTQGLSYAAPVAKSLGLSLESTVALLGQFAQGGIDASRAGTALNSIMSQFLDPASKFRNELAAAGITTGDFEKALHQLAAAGPAGAKAINAVGLESGPALRAMLNLGMDSLDGLVAKLRDAEGEAARTAAVMRDNLNGSVSSMGKAWEYLTNTLGAPVLPVLKDGVDQLAGAFRAAVKDGTVTKFGEAIAAAFQAGIKWVREFLGSVDFTKVAADLRAFADRAGEIFNGFGESAKNAGAIVQTAYGTIQASGNALLTGLYGAATGVTLVIQGVLKGLEMLYLASSKITFGDVSKQYAAIAADLRLQSEGMGAAVEALSVKVRESMGGVVEGVSNANIGITKLAGTVSTADSATAEWKQTVAAANAELALSAAAAESAGAAYQKKTQADQAARQAADDHRAALAQLRSEYAALVASGDLQAAAVKLGEINKALAGTPPASKEAAKAAADAAAQIEAAFDRLGVVSAATLKQQAAAAQRDYATIKDAGTSTAEDIAGAFKTAADKAIAANKGIAPSWVEAEAATRGYEVQVDAAGKSTLKLRDAVESVGTSSGRVAPGMQRDWGGVTSAINTASQAVQEYQQRVKEKYGRPGEGDKPEQLGDGVTKMGGTYRNKDGMASDAKGAVQQQWVWTRASIIEYLQSAGLDEKLSEELAKQFVKSDGTVGYMATSAQKKWGGKYSTLSEALGKMVDYYKYNDQGKAEAANTTRQINENDAALAAQQQRGASAAQPVGGNSGESSGNKTVVNITIDGTTRSVNTDAAGASTLQDLLRQLSAARGTSSIR